MRHLPSHRTRNRVLSIVAIVLLLCGLAIANVLRPLPAVIAREKTLAVQSPPATDLAWPAKGSAAIQVQHVTPMLTHGNAQPVPTASLAKIITALTVLQKFPLEVDELGPPITLTNADLDLYHAYVARGGAVIRVAPGEQLNEYQALQGMLLPSANNIADSVAIWAFGSLSEYHTAATQYVRQIGMADTTIGPDASGMSPDTKSTAADLVLLAEQAIAHPVLAKVFSQKEATLPIEGQVTNVSWLENKDGIVGIKTGSIDGSGGNMLFAATHTLGSAKPVLIAGAILGQSSLAAARAACPPLVASAKANMYIATPVPAGTVIASFATEWSSSATATTRQAISFIAWKGEPVHTQITLQKASVMYQQGSPVGAISATAGSSSGTSDIVMTSSLTDPSWTWRLLRR